MDYFIRNCQPKSLICLFLFVVVLASCSSRPKGLSRGQEYGLIDKEKVTEEIDKLRMQFHKEQGKVYKEEGIKTVKGVPFWFDIPERFTFRERNGEIVLNPFFDLLPFYNRRNSNINFYLVTPAESRDAYDFDIVSGKRYKRFEYCWQEDLWNIFDKPIDQPSYTKGNVPWHFYEKEIALPPYSIGIIPRMLNQVGRPQKIIVFGRTKYYSEMNADQAVSHRVRIVGGVVEQYCEVHPCDNRNAWESRLVLIAVDPADKEFEEILDMRQLKEEVDWEHIKLFWENSEGRMMSVDKHYPAFRILGEIPPERALSFVLTNGHLYSTKEIKKLRKSCHSLYDYIWKNIQEIRETDANVAAYSGVSKERQTDDFGTFFNKFYKKHSEQYNLCSKLVRPANINYDSKRHWFFVYLTALFKMEDMHYVFSCENGKWIDNVRKIYDQRVLNPDVEYTRCSTTQLNKAFEEFFGKLVGIKAGKMVGVIDPNRKYYRYISYDNINRGTHQKIHSWAYFEGKRPSCRRNRNKKTRAARLGEYDGEYDERGRYMFPLDVTWDRFKEN